MADAKTPPAEPKETAVAVKGLVASVDEAALSTMFGVHGKLLRVKLDALGGAHVVFASTRAAQRAAIALNGSVVQGKAISAQHVRSFVKTTRPCRGFQEGKCKKGDKCKYWHPTDGAPTADAPTAKPKKVAPATATLTAEQPTAEEADDISGIPKHAICRNFARGNCVQGTNCRFAHVLGAGALPPPPPASIPAQCSFFAAGRCTKGDECAFLHTDRPPQPPASKKSMCSFFAAGRCARGDQCAYIHEVKTVPTNKNTKLTAMKSVAQTKIAKAKQAEKAQPVTHDSDRTCIECEKPDVAAWICAACDNAKYCDECKSLVHRPKVMRSHTQEPLPAPATRPRCGECEAISSAVQCEDCDVSYCESCDASVHQFKSLRNHTRTPVEASPGVTPTNQVKTVKTGAQPSSAPPHATAAVSQYVDSVPQFDLLSDSESSDDEDEGEEESAPRLKTQQRAPNEASSESEDEDDEEEEQSPEAAALASASGGYVESVPQYELSSESESSDEDDQDDADDDDSVEDVKESIVKAAVVAVKQKIAAPAKTVTPQTASSDSSDSDDDDFEDERPVIPTPAPRATAKPSTKTPVVTEISSESESELEMEPKAKMSTTRAPPSLTAVQKRKVPNESSSSSGSESSEDEDDGQAPPPKQQRVSASSPAAPARPRATPPSQDRKVGISTGSSHSLVKKIEAYEASGSTEVLHLDPNLNGFERLLAHDCAERLGLAHISVGEGLDRHITISRKGGASNKRSSLAEAPTTKKQKRA